MSATREADNKATVTRFEEALSTGDIDHISQVIDELVAPDVTIRTPLPIESTGVDALKEVVDRLHIAFPDLHVQIEDLIAEADKVVSRNTVTGTHGGDFMGIPATGKTVTYNEIFVVRFEEGRVAETWGVVDVASVMRQLAVAP